jgi:AICAR transformylase/IMP cyclohydrolase PurH
MKLKYGMNPYQTHATVEDSKHLRLLNGTPSVINVLDALNSWQLVKEILEYNGSVAAASFKHVTPSGVAIASELPKNERAAYLINPKADISPIASAYIRARGSDRLASFGDFIAINSEVDISAARIIRSEVSNGIIAPGFDGQALEILRKKKGGNYVIFEIDSDYSPPRQESRDVFGLRINQDRNDLVIKAEHVSASIVTENRVLSTSSIDNLCIGMITLKYTQSNSICVVKNGHVVGIGSGQQSRILCTELALSKAKRWHQKLMLDYDSIDFPEQSNRTEKDQIIEKIRKDAEESLKTSQKLDELSLCSDGYFPQTDNIDLAANEGGKYIASPMGSIRDGDIIRKCNEKNIVFCDTGVRLFHH